MPYSECLWQTGHKVTFQMLCMSVLQMDTWILAPGQHQTGQIGEQVVCKKKSLSEI